jgi:16S rRNA processing protein RimM
MGEPPRILLGVIGRPHGVRGLLRVHAYTAEPDGLFAYGPLCDERGRWFSLRPRGDGVCEVAEIVDGKRRPVTDRATAETLVNVRLHVPRDRLPKADEEEFYLADLVGLEAVDTAGQVLGAVAAVHDYGGGPSLEIGTLLVPFTRAAVPQIDLAAGRMTVVAPAEVIAR